MPNIIALDMACTVHALDYFLNNQTSNINYFYVQLYVFFKATCCEQHARNAMHTSVPTFNDPVIISMTCMSATSLTLPFFHC